MGSGNWKLYVEAPVRSRELDATVRFPYDDFGRRTLAEQELTREGVRYRTAYRDHAFDEFGRPSGCTAEVLQAR
jgi:hypothetical protein